MRLKCGRLRTVMVISVLTVGSLSFAPVATAQQSKGRIGKCEVLPRPIQRIRTAYADPAYEALNKLAWVTGDVLESGCDDADVGNMAFVLAVVDASIDGYASGARRWARHPCVAAEINSMHLFVGELVQMVFDECGDGVLIALCSAFPLESSRLDQYVIYELDVTGNGLMGTACEAVR